MRDIGLRRRMKFLHRIMNTIRYMQLEHMVLPMLCSGCNWHVKFLSFLSVFLGKRRNIFNFRKLNVHNSRLSRLAACCYSVSQSYLV